MFTGIVQGMATLVAINKKESFQTHTIELTDKMVEGLAIGASVAHNGCCLTVVKVELSNHDVVAQVHFEHI